MNRYNNKQAGICIYISLFYISYRISEITIERLSIKLSFEPILYVELLFTILIIGRNGKFGSVSSTTPTSPLLRFTKVPCGKGMTIVQKFSSMS